MLGRAIVSYLTPSWCHHGPIGTSADFRMGVSNIRLVSYYAGQLFCNS